MNKTADGYEFEVGRTEWRNESDRKQWETPVTVYDGDKRLRLTVVTAGAVKGAEVPRTVEKSMQEWYYREPVRRPAKV